MTDTNTASTTSNSDTNYSRVNVVSVITWMLAAAGWMILLALWEYWLRI